MADFVMPILGADMEAGTLVAWRKRPGDRVERGEIVADVETDKGAIEVEIFTSGVLESILVQPGAKVPVGTVLATVREDRPAAPAAPTVAPPPGPMTAWRSIECVIAVSRFSRLSVTVSPTMTRTIGPGTVSLKVQYWYVTPSSMAATAIFVYMLTVMFWGCVRVSAGGRSDGARPISETSAGSAGGRPGSGGTGPWRCCPGTDRATWSR